MLLRRHSALLATLAGLALSASLFQVARDRESVRLRAEFERQAAALTAAVRMGWARVLGSLESAGAFLGASPAVTRDAFARFVSRTLPADAGAEALAWLPEGTTLAAYVAPAEGNEALRGFDFASDPERRAAIEKARISGQAAATDRIRLLKDGAAGFLVVLPVHARGGVSEAAPHRPEALVGLVAAEIRIDSLLRGSLRGLDASDLDIEAHEAARPAEGDRAPGGETRWVWASTMEVADRRWRVSARARPEYVARRKTWEAAGLLAAGLSLTALLGLYVFSASRRLAREVAERQRVEEEVRVLNQELARRMLERAEQLEAAYKDLSEQVAERARTEAALRESEEQLRALSERSLDAILVISGDGGRILRANPAARELLGYSLESLVGQHFSVLFPEGPAPPREELLEQLLVHGAAFQEQEFRRADGTTVPMDLTATIVPWGEGQAIIATLRDVTERTEAQRALREREERLRQAEKMEAVGRLAGGVAHDFNNLLMVVSGYAEMLLRRMPPGEPLRKPADQIRNAAERAAALTRQLLSFGRKQVVQPQVLDLNRFVVERESMLRRLVGEGIELRTRVANDGAWIKMDVGQLEQVILNLAANSRDAMPAGGRLTIETATLQAEGDAGAPPGRYVALTVSDMGTGIPPELRDRIFEPFFTTKEKGQATGLGLATVYGIVQQWGGQIQVESEVGQGTTFRILLPQAETPPAAAGTGQPSTPSPALETVLLVEDEPAVRDLAREILEGDGYTVLVAQDAEEAVRLCQRPGPLHLLLTDVVMPGVGGRELAHRLGALRPGLKVLFMSGYTDDETLRRGVREGAGFLSKPFGPDALLRKLREVLDGA